MFPKYSQHSYIQKIDNSRQWLPFATTGLVIFLIALAYWVFSGGSLRLYASVFFGLYFITRRIWVSVILIGILQNIVFLPFRFISLRLSTSLKNFEDELQNIKNEKEQYFLFSRQIREGNTAVIFYIVNFLLNTVAFVSAGRLFLIDFYTQKLNPRLLYHFIPYPDYPLKGTTFRFPFVHITETYALDWSVIFKVWLVILLIGVVPRLLWRLVRFIFWKNQKLLEARINYNRMLAKMGGYAGTAFILSAFILRHIPSASRFLLLSVDLTRQNITLNIITAVGTFITAFHAGYVRQSLASKQAQAAGIPVEVIKKVFKSEMKDSFRNATILGIGAFLITNQIPSAFELSVATFEVIFMLSPYTFDKFIHTKKPAPQPPPTPELEPVNT